MAKSLPEDESYATRARSSFWGTSFPCVVCLETFRVKSSQEEAAAGLGLALSV